jgi:peptidoglycan/LPS O-acetylase OafA/YrhL
VSDPPASDPAGGPTPPPPPLPPVFPPPAGPPKNRGLGWFFAVSGSVVLLLTLGCIVAASGGNPFSEDGELAIICGSPTLILGAVFLWLGSRRLKR